MSKWFQRFALLSADVVGRPVAFLLACLTILVWGGLGPIMKFSDTWQLIISTRRIRDTRAIRLKLDELLRATEGARSKEPARPMRDQSSVGSQAESC